LIRRIPHRDAGSRSAHVLLCAIYISCAQDRTEYNFLVGRVRWCSILQTYQFRIHLVMRYVEHRYLVYYQCTM
jgi:hypothetical protein